MATTITNEKEHLKALSILTLCSEHASAALEHVALLDRQARAEFLELADSHHVVVRSLRSLAAAAAPDRTELQPWITAALAAEQARIQNALEFLDRICRELERAGCPVTVMKSLDHWPDIGNDLDLYSSADGQTIRDIFVRNLGAYVEPRSWGDQLAQKWNFALPGLRENVEVHSQRLGQTGEHVALARRFITRRMEQKIGSYTFMVPAPEERIIVATLQRMYRHFYFRLCDIANSAALVESGELDFDELHRAADVGGIWPGVATYLLIVSDYVNQYRGQPVPLPESVRKAARFGGEKLYVLRRFLRVPLLPEGAELYTKQVASTALRGDVLATFRLSLLPPLAAAASVAFKITGNDKGIW
ncbi:MAG: nucleotidyltransferase family protein [Terriglobales bacterium]